MTLCQPAHVGNTLKLLCILILVEMFTLLNMDTKSKLNRILKQVILYTDFGTHCHGTCLSYQD